MMEYNTGRGFLLMRQYGRYIQKMVAFLHTVNDQPILQRNAESIIEMMAFLTPSLKTMEDYRQKLWDDLIVMGDFKLDIKSPYPVPDKETYKAPPKPLPYPASNPRYNHLGKNIELVIDKAMKEPDAEKKSGFAHAIAYYMKLAYSTYHNELVHDDAIRQELNNITKGELEFTNTPYVRHRAAPIEELYPTKRVNKYKLQNTNNRDRDRQGGNGNRQGVTGNINGNNVNGIRGANSNNNNSSNNSSNNGGKRHKFGKKKFL